MENKRTRKIGDREITLKSWIAAILLLTAAITINTYVHDTVHFPRKEFNQDHIQAVMPGKNTPRIHPMDI